MRIRDYDPRKDNWVSICEFCGKKADFGLLFLPNDPLEIGSVLLCDTCLSEGVYALFFIDPRRPGVTFVKNY